MNIKVRTFMGVLIGGIIFSALLFHAAGYGEGPATGQAQEPARKPMRWRYKSGQLFAEKIYGNKISEWTVKEYYESGPLKSETPYKDGKREGIVKEYYKSGKLRSEISYKDGKRDGPFKAYYENGELKGEMAYKNGEIEGVLRYDQQEPLTKEIMQELAERMDSKSEKE
jgi:antitoxin component YwqK of YwqJK toxin-antitoxin module